jgi:PhzF family phenazine biosynthesis protein
MEIPYYLVNSFTSQLFAGATSAVLLPQVAPPKEMLAPIVAELGARDAAYVFVAAGAFHIRWFGQRGELPLCTHATLAAAHAVIACLDPGRTAVTFSSQGGPIHVALRDGFLATDLPRLLPTPSELDPGLARALRVPPVEVLRAGKYVVVYKDEKDLRALAPDPVELGALDAPGLIACAPGDGCDVACRTFAIAGGAAIEEEVSASAQCRVVPYWSKRTGKSLLRVRQLSPRGAELLCEEAGGRVHVAGHAVRVAVGTLFV